MQTNLYFELNNGFYMVMLGSARLLPLFILLPWLSQSTLTGLFKFPLAFLLGASLWHAPGVLVAQLELMAFTGLMIKEVVIGLLIAILLCLPFWTMHAVGSLIDNQRGATLSSTLNPLSGIDTSELANLFNLLAVVIVLEAGGVLTLLEVLKQSYQLWPPLSSAIPGTEQMARYIGELMKQALRLSAPVLTIFLISEFFLGLLARYTPQMNAFSLALTLKTLIGFMVLLLYFSPVLPSEVLRLETIFFPLH
ncbi:type III secretion system export apparatus subunit SctT [Erwiniaceae bacterium BAC15a-03b]|uniref:Type III secretion system export apparatus subunit SctT n=1 Tax=Winslowiella arboricola TaxID=2978220 RepID=A0A9J6PLM6_9GAMM|nr:type III secretion system export apparatus subunit SctT [Winslowiella arboricola]MCU5773760.1 type III secretion system export apparatus subunit SctT [Winslowiella arboricola]MCU5777670.1 type III secretion system export apparatus subunit SctT [Winslowiella arboricola]